MNNANFEQDYRNNANNAKFQLIFDERNEITEFPITEFQNFQQFEQNISTVKHKDPYKTARIRTFESQNNDELDALKCLKEK